MDSSPLGSRQSSAPHPALAHADLVVNDRSAHHITTTNCPCRTAGLSAAALRMHVTGAELGRHEPLPCLPVSSPVFGEGELLSLLLFPIPHSPLSPPSLYLGGTPMMSPSLHVPTSTKHHWSSAHVSNTTATPSFTQAWSRRLHQAHSFLHFSYCPNSRERARSSIPHVPLRSNL